MSGILKNKKIAVLMGGPGSEREVSLRSGEAVSRALQSCGAITVALDITGPDFTLPAGTDLAFNMIHGTFGEDGQLQGILEARDMPYTGENAECSRIAFDKILTKEKFDAAGVPTAEWKKLRAGDKAPFDVPYVVKAPRQGSSVGVHIIKDGKDFDAAMKDCLQFGDEVLVEKFVKGVNSPSAWSMARRCRSWRFDRTRDFTTTSTSTRRVRPSTSCPRRLATKRPLWCKRPRSTPAARSGLRFIPAWTSC